MNPPSYSACRLHAFLAINARIRFRLVCRAGFAGRGTPSAPCTTASLSLPRPETQSRVGLFCPRFMQAALTLQPEEARLLLGGAIGELGRGVPVADRHVPLHPERVVGQVVARQIVVDVLVVPVDDRVHLQVAVLDTEDRQVAARLALRAS